MTLTQLLLQSQPGQLRRPMLADMQSHGIITSWWRSFKFLRELK